MNPALPSDRHSGTAEPTTLVIGCGNTLRGDDAAGPIVAEAIGLLGPRGVETLVCHQLTPELSARLAGVDRVVFVDAEVAPAPDEIGRAAALSPDLPAPTGRDTVATALQPGTEPLSGGTSPLARARPIELGTPLPTTLGHVGDPATLLALARGLFGRAPQAWLVTVPASDFAYGAGLSPRCEAAIAPAVALVKRLCAI